MPPLTEEITTTHGFIFSLITEPDKGKSQTPGDKTTLTTSQTPVTGTDSTDSGKKTPNPDDGTTTLAPEKKKKHVVKYTGNQPGAVAGTAIAMLLVGVTIGASGTFYKFNGLPECMRR